MAPRTPAEQRIADILGRVLGIDRVGVEDSFFELGGHSLLAMQVLFRIREAFRVEMSARLLYSSAFTAADLALLPEDGRTRASVLASQSPPVGRSCTCDADGLALHISGIESSLP